MANENSSLIAARQAKKDEFYTQLNDIQNELYNYKDHFRDKVVFCNCDDPVSSNFWRFFSKRFNLYGLKKLISTHYEPSGKPSYMLSMERIGNETPPDIKPLAGDGDFRSPECVELMKEADIVVTNPPFSLFREYVAQLMEHDKKFIIIGNQNAITYKEIFPLLRDNKMWLGYHCGDMAFAVPPHYEERSTRFWIDENGQKWRSMGNICWYTNLDIKKRHEDLTLYAHYSPEEYPRYDNYDAIEVGKVAAIPCDYFGVMGVPITFMNKYNPEQFEILGDSRYHDGQTVADDINVINGKTLFRRILIRRKQNGN